MRLAAINKAEKLPDYKATQEFKGAVQAMQVCGCRGLGAEGTTDAAPHGMGLRLHEGSASIVMACVNCCAVASIVMVCFAGQPPILHFPQP